jgi:hypothetical protein
MNYGLRIGLAGLAFLALIFLAAPVFAIPGIPAQFTGTVTINSNPAPNGTTVIATIETDSYSTTTVSGIYGTEPAAPFFVQDPNANRSGKIIHFFVNGINTGISAIFETGSLLTINLAITQEEPPAPPSGNPGGGGGGGGGGGSPSLASFTITLEKACAGEENVVTVTNASSQAAVAGAGIKILKGNETALNGNTDADGKFLFTLTESGQYAIEAQKTGFSKAALAFQLNACGDELPIAPSPIAPGTEEGNPADNDQTVSGSTDTTAGLGNNGIPTTGLFGLGTANTSILLGIVLIIGLAALFVGWKRSHRTKK